MDRLVRRPVLVRLVAAGGTAGGGLVAVPDAVVAIAARCGIATHLTFHVGRHTFATVALNRGMPVETLSRILGHTNIRTTQIYAKITDKKVSADMAALADSLSSVEENLCLLI